MAEENGRNNDWFKGCSSRIGGGKLEKWSWQKTLARFALAETELYSTCYPHSMVVHWSSLFARINDCLAATDRFVADDARPEP